MVNVFICMGGRSIQTLKLSDRIGDIVVPVQYMRSAMVSVIINHNEILVPFRFLKVMNPILKLDDGASQCITHGCAHSMKIV